MIRGNNIGGKYIPNIIEMARTPSCDKTGLKKGTWTSEEDRKLEAYVTRYGSWNWRQLPRFAGLERCGKSCRLRWLNYLRPNIKRGNYTEEEEEIIMRLHKKLGNKWSMIATHLPGRTDNEIKNHWHTTLKKRFEKNAIHTNENVKATKSNSSGSSEQDRVSIQNNGFFHGPSPTTSKTSDTAPLSPQSSTTTNENMLGEDGFDFLDACAQDFAFLEAIEPTTAKNFTESYVADMSLVPNELLAPFVNESEDYFSSLYDADLWSQRYFHDLDVSLFQ